MLPSVWIGWNERGIASPAEGGGKTAFSRLRAKRAAGLAGVTRLGGQKKSPPHGLNRVRGGDCGTRATGYDWKRATASLLRGWRVR